MKKSFESVDELAVLAKDDELMFAELLEAYKPFIFSVVKKTSSLYYIDVHDDYASIGMIAFYNAVKRYEPDKGSFLKFAGTVIRNRIVDELRVSAKWAGKFVEVDYDPDSEDEAPNVVDLASIKRHREQVEADERRLEIDALNEELAKCGISFNQVYADAPKRDDGRDTIWGAVKFICENEQKLQELFVKKQLPMNELEKNLAIPRKKLEKSRRFIVAAVLIRTGDYPRLSEFVRL